LGVGKKTNVPLLNGAGSTDTAIWKPTGEMFSNWPGYIWGLCLIAVITFLGQFASEIFSLENILTFYLLSVVISAIYWGLGPSILVSVASVVALDYFFIPPLLGFFPISFQDVVTIAVLLSVSVLISYLASRFRQKTEEARRREHEASALYSLSRDLARSTELVPSIRHINRIGKSIFAQDITIFLPDPMGKGALIDFAKDPDIAVTAGAYSMATWSFEQQLVAGRGTESFSDAKERYVPLRTPRGPLGVMVLWHKGGTTVPWPSEHQRLLEAFADLASVSIESIMLAEQVQKAEVLKAKEKLQTALLNSISHDLRTPLVSVIGVLSSLQEEGLGLDEEAKRNLIQVAREDSDRLNRLIANLLDITRIEAGAVRITRQPSDVADLIGVALEQLGTRAANRSIDIDVPAELSFVDVDFNLVVQVLVNLVDNALKYSPAESAIQIGARRVNHEIEVELADHGVGIPQADLPHVFDKFYKVQRPNINVPGTGLGLSICKGIVEAHGGRIWAENRLGGGTIIKLTLPVAEATAQIGTGAK
jgi:two-component system, OmpR family, sensor histidine kinase KdpD